MPSSSIPNALYDGVLVLLVDGARPDVLRRLAESGEAPVFKRHFIDAGGFRDATSVFPSVSGPAHLPVLTGAHPGRANLPGIRWAERPTRAEGGFLGRTRSYMAPFRASKLARDIPAGISTMFSHIPKMADVNTWFVRGCPGAARRTRFSKVSAFLRSFLTKDWYSSDLQAEKAVISSFEAGFTSVFSVFPAVDELGHRFGPMTEESFEAYRRFDKVLGRMIDALTRMGRLERTLLVITSDHGQSGTTTHVDLDPLVEELYPRTVIYPKFWRHARGADAAIMVSGNSMANIYLRGPGGWTERPRFDDSAGPAAALLAKLLAHPAIELVIHRAEAPNTYVIRGPHGARTIEVARAGADGESSRGQDRGQDERQPPVRLRTSVTGVDPLGCGELPSVLDKDQALALTAGSAFPDALWQVAEFYRSPRAGDLVVCAKPGFDLRSRFEYQPHLGSHGALNREHMMVPAAVNARWAGVEGQSQVQLQTPLQAPTCRSVDLFPSILQALGRPLPGGLDGEARILQRP